MCGRFALSPKTNEVENLMPGVRVKDEAKTRYNIAPSQNIISILNNKEPEQVFVKWGLIPNWSKDDSIGYKMINARAETLDEKPSFKQSFLKRRCLIPATGFYEWKKEGKDKYPYFIKLINDKVFTFAGLWDRWKSADGSEVISATIITTTPNSLMANIHDRMPVIIPEESRLDWLYGKQDGAEFLKSLMGPYPGNEMQAYPVGKFVNSPANDFEECMKPVF
jgi:putative SOS response-associated peptidase YedK